MRSPGSENLAITQLSNSWLLPFILIPTNTLFWSFLFSTTPSTVILNFSTETYPEFLKNISKLNSEPQKTSFKLHDTRLSIHFCNTSIHITLKKGRKERKLSNSAFEIAHEFGILQHQDLKTCKNK